MLHVWYIYQDLLKTWPHCHTVTYFYTMHGSYGTGFNSDVMIRIMGYLIG